MLTWTIEMSTGDPTLDYHHRTLIDKFNEFTIAWERGEDGRQVAGEVLDFLQFYAQWHFKREEQCMTKYQCPVATTNAEQHELFLIQFGAFYEQWQTGNLSRELALQTHLELGLWIREHIMRTDSKLRSCIHKTEATPAQA